MAESLNFALVPHVGKRVRFDALEAAIVEMRKLIRDVDAAVFRAEGVTRPRRWYVERLSSSDPTIALITDDGNSPLERRTDLTIVDGMREIVSGDFDSPPLFFSEQELEGLLALKRRVLAKGLDRIDVGSAANERRVSIFPSIEQNVNRILGGTVDALGSLDGELDAINTRRYPYFTMWELMTRQAVKVHFDIGRIEEIKALLHQTVRVSGLVRYFANGKPRAISQMEMIRDITQPRRTTPYKDFWGSVPTLGRGVDTVDFLRRANGDT